MYTLAIEPAKRNFDDKCAVDCTFEKTTNQTDQRF